MKYVDGRGLDEILESQGPLPIPAVLHVMRAAISALAYAHGQGIVHRDVKGGNIMVDRDGRVMVTDFGIARAMEDASLTATGSVVGTPFYMSPEQCAAKRIGPQSDQYSLGVVAFQMLTGFVPFNAETLPGIMHHHFYTPVPDLAASRRGVPAALMTIINRALSKKADHRYPTTEAMLDALEAVPFSAEERRQGEDDLRTLARGGLLLRIEADPLPPMVDPTRGTPTGSVPVFLEPPRRAIDWKAKAAAIILAAIGVGWAGASLRGTGKTPAPVANAEATTTGVPRATRDLPANAGTRAAHGPSVTALGPGSGATPEGPAAVTPAAVIPPAPGLIRARAYPVDAEIFVDGESLGRGVVLDARVPSGRRRLRVRAPGYTDFDSTIVVVAGETTQIPRITLRPTEVAP
jgi:hypothetical protein